jgi:hypothetical protein
MAPFLTLAQTDTGNVLLRMGVCSEEQIKAARAVQATRPPSDTAMRIGELLIAAGAITREELKAALRLQKQMRNGQAVTALATINAALTEELRKVG